MLEPHITDRRFVPDGEKKFYVKNVWEKHQEILRRLVLGQDPDVIAQDLNIARQTVSAVRNSPICREMLHKLSNQRDEEVMEITQRIKEFTPIALQYLEDIITGEIEGASASLRARTAESYVSRAGYGAITKIAHSSGAVTKDDIEKLKERAREAALNQEAIEVEYENA